MNTPTDPTPRTAATAREALEAWLWRHAGNAHDLRSFAYPGTWRLGYLHCRNCIEDEDFTFTPAALAAAEAPAGVADPCPAGPECDSCRKNREAPGRVSGEVCERTHWDGTVLLSERNHYLAGCPCPQGPWCVPHGWSGTGAEHHAICADHEHVAAYASPAGVSGEHRWEDCTAGQDCPQPQCNPDDEGNCRACGGPFIAPAPTPSEPVERCVEWLVGLRHCDQTEAEHGRGPGQRRHPFTPATRDE